MSATLTLKSALDFQRAFHVEPEIVAECSEQASIGLGLYAWSTPKLEGFQLGVTDDLVIALHMGGSRRVRALHDGTRSRSRSLPGLLTVLPAGRAAAFITDGSVDLVSLHIPSRALDPARRWLSRFAFQDAYACAAMGAMLHAAGTPALGRNEYLARIAEALLLHLAYGDRLASSRRRSAATRTSGDKVLVPALDYIDANLGMPLDIDSLARQAHLSRSAFLRRFRRACGLSPHQYVTARRVATAQALLTRPGLDLAFVAYELGFASQSHFTAVFRQATGITPLQFRLRAAQK